MADEYAFDDQAQKMQGKLATDKLEDKAAQDQEMEQDDPNNDDNLEQDHP